ncbi:MAG: GIY-YIG nuclease family protein [Gemmataceae bacterium]
MFHVYVIRSESTGRRYTGSCEDLDDRLRRHNAGESKATKHGMPWTLIHREEFPSRAEAMRREKFLKSGQGRQVLQAMGL